MGFRRLPARSPMAGGAATETQSSCDVAAGDMRPIGRIRSFLDSADSSGRPCASGVRLYFGVGVCVWGGGYRTPKVHGMGISRKYADSMSYSSGPPPIGIHLDAGVPVNVGGGSDKETQSPRATFP